ncbi:MAG: NAD-binding protein, partial [Planctomycetota bacterium]
TFDSDLGRGFSIIVLLTGVVFLLILLPFTVIQFFYAPWVEAQAAARTPRAIASGTSGHVVLTHHDAVSASFIKKLKQFGHEYVVVVADMDQAMRLHDEGVSVVLGSLEEAQTYERVRATHAAMIAATGDDIANTNVAFTARQVAPEIPIIATAKNATSLEVMERAGATSVLVLGDMMGAALARCMVGGDAISHVVGAVDELLIAEANAHRTPLVGKTLRENRLSDLGVSVLGLWNRGHYESATPDTVVTENAILLLAGSRQQLDNYDEQFVIYNISVDPVLILGGGRVGAAAARALETRGIGWRMVERDPDAATDLERTTIGDVADPATLRAAGIDQAPAVLVTTPDDALNVYTTIYCRAERPNIQIISRATLEQSVERLHRAGADFVFSYASMGATNLFNRMKRSHILPVAEGLDVFRVKTPASLDGATIMDCGVREQTGCTIVAVRDASGTLQINPRPNLTLETGKEMILVGNNESESRFMAKFAGK